MSRSVICRSRKVEECREISRNVEVGQSVEECRGMSRSFEKCREMSRNVEECRGRLIDVEECRLMSIVGRSVGLVSFQFSQIIVIKLPGDIFGVSTNGSS